MGKLHRDNDHSTSELARQWFACELSLIQTNPEAARAAIEEIERKAKVARTALAEANGDCGLNGEHVSCMSPDTLSNGYAKSADVTGHGLTRNQLSKVRGVYIMNALAEEGGPHTLAVIHECLREPEFRDEMGRPATEAAIRAHLYRLKEQKVVEVVSNGLYKLSAQGFTHLEHERRAQAPLIEKFRAAQT